MKAEDVPAEWMAVAERDLPPGLPLNTAMLRAALAAVAPLIAAAEREASAKVAETHPWYVGGIGTMAPGSGESRSIAAAIRARSDAP